MVAVLGLALATVPAIGAAYLIATHAFPGRRVVVVLAQAFLSFPTVLVGLVLYLLFTRQGPLGSFSLLFSPSGMIFGQAVIGFPRGAGVLARGHAVGGPTPARDRLGARRRPLAHLFTVLRELRFGLMAAVVAGFGRVIAEVGSALMIGGNIEGSTRTITTAIALETSKGEFAQGIALGIVLVALALAVNVMLAWLQGAGGSGDDRHAAHGAGPGAARRISPTLRHPRTGIPARHRRGADRRERRRQVHAAADDGRAGTGTGRHRGVGGRRRHAPRGAADAAPARAAPARGLYAPASLPVPHLGTRQHRLRPAGQGRGARRDRAARGRGAGLGPASSTCRTPRRRSCPAAKSSA